MEKRTQGRPMERWKNCGYQKNKMHEVYAGHDLPRKRNKKKKERLLAFTIRVLTTPAGWFLMKKQLTRLITVQ